MEVNKIAKNLLLGQLCFKCFYYVKNYNGCSLEFKKRYYISGRKIKPALIKPGKCSIFETCEKWVLKK